MSDTQPAVKLRDGKITVTVWENTTEEGKVFYSTNLIKSYKDSEDNWQETTSLNSDELLKASLLLQNAYSKIVELKQAS